MNSFTINPNTHTNTPIDPQHLYNEGIDQLIELSSEVWTDYNKHDPGVTFLEVLSYLLTELNYKTDWPIADILVDGMSNSQMQEKQDLLNMHFPAANEVLPSAPLTLRDYRKLLADILNVNNAWVVPYSVSLYHDSTNNSVTRSVRKGKTITILEVKGGYKVKLLLANGLTQVEKNVAIEAATQCLHANRNLCEWFDTPEIIAKQNFIVCAEIEIEAKANPLDVSAAIWLAIQEYLQKPIPHLLPETTLEAIPQDIPQDIPQSIDWAQTLFNGPLLQHGYISDEALAASDLRTQIRLSDIINIVMDIQGVVAVSELTINPEGLTQALDDPWLVPVDANKQPSLSPQKGNLAFFKRELPIFYDKPSALSLYRKLLKETQQTAQKQAVYDLSVKTAQSRAVLDYHSVQWDLPAVYGLSEAGLPGDTPELRKAMVLQLRGFLSFFDQTAANFLAQTHHLRDLLSLNKDELRSYFSQLPSSIKDWQKLYGNEPQASRKLHALISDSALDLDRRNRFLDFMVARFGEDMTGLTDIMLNAFEPSLRKTLDYKIDFHKGIESISANRGIAHNISLKKEVWNSLNVSGLATRLCRLLGIANHSRRNLSDIVFDKYTEIDKNPNDEFRFRVRNKVDNKILLSSSTNYATKADATKEMRLAILLGMEDSFYAVAKATNGKYFFNIVDDSAKVVARRIEFFETLDEVNSAIRQCIDYLNINYSNEGMYIIEQSLLLPESDADPSLPVCIEDGCEECADPYSYQIHIVLMGFGKRLGNMDFRRYCEGVIRSEVPAHIMPKVCWIDKDNMAQLEKAYKNWLAIKHGASSVDASKKKQALINALAQIHNLYPVEQLHDCESDETGFVIGRTALGTLKEST